MEDIILSLFLLIITIPLMIAAALLIKITSPAGPVLYLQKRTGLNGRPFIMYKLRTMQPNAEKKRPRWAKAGDLRVLPVGRILRRFRIDELPQLFNVLKGDMSLIGPRPERPFFTSKLMRSIPFYARRLQIKPGLTGWAQVNYQYTDTEKGAREKLLYDLFYIQNASLALDFLIALKTFRVVLTGRGAH
ncbi:MAG: sugar transferase [Candidatus Omnitrophica bacterium]|nr:sugar transferase [Candidatus Omnitrophota bacterium]